MSHGHLPRLSRNRPIVVANGVPHPDFHREWQTVVEHVEDNEEAIEGKQPSDADLAAIAALTGTGLARRTGTNAWALLPYEAGTFTPILRFGGATTGIAYSAQLGSYTRVGNRVLFEITIDLSNKGSATGPATIAGLPFVAAGFAGGHPRVTAMSTVVTPSFIILSAGTTVLLQQLTTGSQANLTNANFTDTSNIVVSGSYPV